MACNWAKNKDKYNKQRRERYANDPKWRQLVIDRVPRREFRSDALRDSEASKRETLSDGYVIQVIKKSFGYKIKRKDIPKELIELERLKIKTIRQLKKSNNDNRH
jgi:hypothetical protein